MFDDDSYEDCLIGICTGQLLSPQKSNQPTSTKIGGLPVWHDNDFAPTISLFCKNCGSNDNVVMAAQVFAPTEVNRSLYIFACNNRSCSLQSRGWTVIRNQEKSLVQDGTEQKEFSEVFITPAANTDLKNDSVWNFLKDDQTTTKSSPVDNAGASFSSGFLSQEASLESLAALLEARDSSLLQSTTVPHSTMSARKSSQSQAKPLATIANSQSLDLIQGQVWPSFRVDEVLESNLGYQPSICGEAGAADIDAESDLLIAQSQSISDEKIADMLARYLSTEEDQDVVESLRSVGIVSVKAGKEQGRSATQRGAGAITSTKEKNAQGEKCDNDDEEGEDDQEIEIDKGRGRDKKLGGEGEEGGEMASESRLARSDRKSVTENRFQQRVALSPKQVIRYAYGGRPLWCSYPSPLDPQTAESPHSPSVSIPPCELCGRPREFEMQLMPALLCLPLPGPTHSDTARNMGLTAAEATGDSLLPLTPVEEKRSSNASSTSSLLERLGAGIDFGVVTVWSCPASCDPAEFVAGCSPDEIGASEELGKCGGGGPREVPKKRVVCYEVAVVQPPSDIG